MKKTIIIGLLSIWTVFAFAQDTLRIMTINIHQGSDTTLQAIGELIQAYSPALVAVQEIDMWPNRPEAPQHAGKNFIAELSMYADMMGYFGKAWDHPGGWFYGDGLMTKYPVHKLETVILPYNKSLSGSEPRQITLAHMTIAGHPVCFASTHLCHMSKENRKAQMKAIRKIMQRQKEKVKIVCGDLNSDPSEELINTTMKNWRDLLPQDNTFPSNGNAYAKYDYILTKKKSDIEVVNAFYICEERITDHCICVVDVVIP